MPTQHLGVLVVVTTTFLFKFTPHPSSGPHMDREVTLMLSSKGRNGHYALIYAVPYNQRGDVLWIVILFWECICIFLLYALFSLVDCTCAVLSFVGDRYAVLLLVDCIYFCNIVIGWL